MLGLKMFLSLLLSLAATCTVASNWTNETAVEYWVRPDNTSACPPSIPPTSQCVTITDLVTDSTNTSINGGVSVNVVFLPGTHVPKKTGFVVVGYSDIDQQTAQQITANFTNTLDQQNVIINCDSDHPIGFVFFLVLSLTFKSVKLQNCGFELSINVDPLQWNGVISSLVVVNVSELFMESVSIVKSRGAGIIVVITEHYKTNVIALNRLMIDGSSGNKGTGFGLVNIGNLFIMEYSRSRNYTPRNSTTDITITDSTISNGCNLFSCLGGLSLQIEEHVSTERAHVIIENCKFINNSANIGGGINLYTITGNTPNNNIQINITKSLFLNNIAKIKGGGLSLYTEGCILNISDTMFIQNTARYRLSLWRCNIH